MSFIEKNKVWLLPLLGLGILGVGYMNYRTLSGEPPPPESAPEQVEAVQNPEASPLPAAAPVQTGEDLWSDLKVFAVLPGNLAQEESLRDRARVALGPELEAEAPLALGKPGWASLSTPSPAAVSAGTPSPGSIPQLDFLVHGSRGSYAWFGGRAYGRGEEIQGSGYALYRIGPTFVELTGGAGRVVLSTNPLHSDVSLSAEAP